MIKYIATWSGGKDSTYMIDWLIRNNKQIDEIIFCDTGYEFNYLKNYILRIKNYWENLGYKVTILNKDNALNIWNKWMFGRFTKGKYKGRVRGFPPTLSMSYCTRELKVVPFNKYIKQYYRNIKVVRYIGYAYNEKRRWNNKKQDELYPLVDIKITEKEILNWILDKNNIYYNKLYEDFNRLGCYICPKQSTKSIYTLIKKYPCYWKHIKQLEEKLIKENAVFPLFAIHGTSYYESKV